MATQKAKKAKKKTAAKKTAAATSARTTAKKAKKGNAAPARKAAKKGKAAPARKAAKGKAAPARGAAKKKAAKKAAPSRKTATLRATPKPKPPAKKAKAPARTKAPRAAAKPIAVPDKPFQRRDHAGHIDPQYAADLLAQGEPREPEPRSFLDQPRSGDDLAEELGEAFVQEVTSAEYKAEDTMNAEVIEEVGGPFVETDGKTEFAPGTDPSNPESATREPFPRS
jgi:hypothetical protein